MMGRFLNALQAFFGREPSLPLPVDPLLHGGLNAPAHHELYYAALMEREWLDKYRDYPWPPGWNG